MRERIHVSVTQKHEQLRFAVGQREAWRTTEKKWLIELLPPPTHPKCHINYSSLHSDTIMPRLDTKRHCLPDCDTCAPFKTFLFRLLTLGGVPLPLCKHEERHTALRVCAISRWYAEEEARALFCNVLVAASVIDLHFCGVPPWTVTMNWRIWSIWGGEEGTLLSDKIVAWDISVTCLIVSALRWFRSEKMASLDCLVNCICSVHW